MILTTKTIKFHPFNKQKVLAKLTIRDKINTCNLFFFIKCCSARIRNRGKPSSLQPKLCAFALNRK